jgi:phenylalanyl-tRNA synthetase beta chain
MRVPVAWLREFVEVPADQAGLEAFCDALTMAGLEVEEILETPGGPTLYTKITPNRGDWASVYGTAREAAAALLLVLKPLPSPVSVGIGEAGRYGAVSIEDADACPRYAAKIIRGVTIGPTPAWIQERLYAALGDKYKPVNNVVDITNYVMLELGQPLHAFDLDTLPQGKIVVRQAHEGEIITTLDEVERNLAPGMLCICDVEKPIAVAGVMGGGPTEITAETTNILLESAHFEPLSVRRTARKLDLRTEASYRFERYVDPALVPIAAERAARMIVEAAGGEAVPGLVDVVAKKIPPQRLLARVERIRALLGADMDRDEMIAGLERLGISVERSAGALDCLIPSWRPDLTIEDDIAEEVGRIALGYGNLPETEPPVLAPRGSDSARGLFLTAVREALARQGVQEVHSHSLTAPAPLATEEETARRVVVRSALSPELSTLRASLWPNLLHIAARAHAAGIRDIALFEVGPIYLRAKAGGGYVEPLRVSGVLSGSAMPLAWSLKPEVYPMDLFFTKGVVEELMAALGIRDAAFAPGTHPITHPGRTAAVSVDGEAIGLIAELSEATVEVLDLPRRTYVFDLDGDALLRLFAGTQVRYSPLPKYPAVVRDLAPVFATTVSYDEIERTAREAAGSLLESLRLTDVYTGANIGEANRSLTLRFTFRSPTGTLKEAEVEAVLAQVRVALTAIGGDFRGA